MQVAGAAPSRRQREVPTDEVDRWCAEYHRTRDTQLRDRIAAAHQWLVAACARRMRRRDEPFDDLVQVGNIGLIKAIDRFDPAVGTSFHAYASATILGELRRHYRTVWRVRVPRSVQERYVAVNAAIDDLTGTLRRSPTPQEVADHLEAALDDVLEAMSIGSALWVGSLSGGGGDGNGPDLPVEIPCADLGLLGADDRIHLVALIQRLNRNERTVLYLRLFHDLRQSEIGERLGISQVQVSRLLRRAITALRELMREAETAAV